MSFLFKWKIHENRHNVAPQISANSGRRHRKLLKSFTTTGPEPARTVELQSGNDQKKVAFGK
jgi:hypothetical protein